MRRLLRALGRRSLSFRLRVTQHLRLSWTTSRLRSLRRRRQRAQILLQRLEAELRHQLLETKELQELHQQLEHRLQELNPPRMEFQPLLPATEQLQQLLRLPEKPPTLPMPPSSLRIGG